MSSLKQKNCAKPFLPIYGAQLEFFFFAKKVEHIVGMFVKGPSFGNRAPYEQDKTVLQTFSVSQRYSIIKSSRTVLYYLN